MSRVSFANKNTRISLTNATVSTKDVESLLLSKPVSRVVHVKARSPHPQYNVQRSPVPDDKVHWDVLFLGYNPPDYTHSDVTNDYNAKKERSWADPPDSKAIVYANRKTHENDGSIILVDGRPRNPMGRTGLQGRGLLGRWGPNHAADPIVTRLTDNGLLEMVAIQRKDTGDWAIPGGMVDAGEAVSQTLQREFREEAFNVDVAKQEAMQSDLAHLFQQKNEIYKGYVDDPRNTDNAWMETQVFWFQCPPALGNAIPLHAGDDAAKVRWVTIYDTNTNTPASLQLYASHASFVHRVVEKFKVQFFGSNPWLSSIRTCMFTSQK